MKGISEIVGLADGVGQVKRHGFRALRQIICARCSGAIIKGEVFTRRTLHGCGFRILPQCQMCVHDRTCWT
jgi:hypothetical protein